jgi:hypothetical protein
VTRDDEFALPPNPKLLNLDEDLLKAAGDLVPKNAELMFMHLRDAREFLRHSGDDAVMAKGCIVLASAALESNLSHLSAVGLAFTDARPSTYSTPQFDFLKGHESVVDDRGQVVSRPLRQSLEDRLRIVPDLLARAIGRRYQLPSRSRAVKKLRETISRRDAIIHPRWDRYLRRPGGYDAAVAVDAVELYLESVSSGMHPYLMGYFAVLGTIPPGWHKNDGVDVGYRTRGKRDRSSGFVRMSDVGLLDVIAGEWRDANMLTTFALDSGVEGDSEGSSLSRAALILLYAMIDAELAIMAQWRIAEDPTRFEEAELNFLSEIAAGIGHDGEVTIDQDKQSFKKRITAVRLKVEQNQLVGVFGKIGI